MAALLDGQQRNSSGKTRSAVKAGAGCALRRSRGLATDAASTAEGENCRRYARQPFTVHNVAGQACAHKKAALNARPEYGGVRRLNIDVCRFEGVLFDKGATRFNGVPHQGREQLVSGNRVLDGHA